MLIIKNTRLFIIPWLVLVSLGISCSNDESDFIEPSEPVLSSFLVPLATHSFFLDSVVFGYTNNRVLNEITLYTAQYPHNLNDVFNLSCNIMFERDNDDNIIEMKVQYYNNNELGGESTTTFEYDNGLIVKSSSSNKNVFYTYNLQDQINRIESHSKISDGIFIQQINYDTNGNVQEFIYNEDQDFKASFPQYDSEINPFAKVPLPKPILLSLVEIGFFIESSYQATILSQNNLMMIENTYRSDNYPRQININNPLFFKYNYTDEL